MPEQTPNMNDLIRQLAQQQQEKLANDIIESQIKIVSASYDKAVTYTNIVVIGGYASFFGLWSLTKQYLTATQALWAALIMLASVCTFVFFEVYKMIITTRALLDRAKIFEDPVAKTDPKVLLDKLREFEQSYKRHNVLFIRIWWINVIVAVATALVAIGILVFSFVYGLLGTI